PKKAHMKSARTVGDVIGKYHPHGDSAVYDTMVRLAQDFSMRVPLIDGHGNFGSIDGDSPAAMRYTEARLEKAAMELLQDLEKNTVDFVPNYDESLEEPKVLPARFPNLLVNGSNGIAVGMATNIPPHNLGETIEATCTLIDNPDISTQELIKVLPGPDFPTGAVISGRKGILDAYETGRGSIKVRANYKIIEKKGGRSTIVIKEIPYQVNRNRLLESIGELVRDKKLPEISNVQDAADRHGIDIIIDLKQNAIPQVVINKLFKATQLQTSFGVIMLALVDNVPKVLNLRQMLQLYIDHQVEVITRRTKFDLVKAEARAQVLEGYIIALDNINEVIKIIRGSKTDKEAAEKMTKQFDLSKKQIDAILEMKLRRLTGLEREKIKNELKELREKICYFRKILESHQMVLNIIKEEMCEIKKKFDTPRRTRITGEEKNIDVEDLIANERVVVTMTSAGYVKRMNTTTYRAQKRGGKGLHGVNLKENDIVEHLFVANTHDYLLFFTSKGKVYRIKVYEVPEGSRHARGSAIVNLLQLDKDESVSAVISTKDFSKCEFLLFATESGMVKKTPMTEYDKTRRDGLIAINLKDGDRLISVKRVTSEDKVVMVSSTGKAIIWETTEIRSMGRATQGVRGMLLTTDAKVLGMEVAKTGCDLLVITKYGYGKRTSLDQYPIQHRGGKGVNTIFMTEKKGQLSAMRVVWEDEEIFIITEAGIVVKTPVKGISCLGRATQGVRIMNVHVKDKVTALAISAEGEKKPEEPNLFRENK
ncbi:MAG: DNA gyrase subunit A, partial [Eggerthellaceae bacterium]|nr:DNA gyrase subunit A [Eggerthellaceae bacterium]